MKIAIFVGFRPIFIGFWLTKLHYFPIVHGRPEGPSSGRLAPAAVRTGPSRLPSPGRVLPALHPGVRRPGGPAHLALDEEGLRLVRGGGVSVHDTQTRPLHGTGGPAA
jgi:hypothetical protein